MMRVEAPQDATTPEREQSRPNELEPIISECVRGLCSSTYSQDHPRVFVLEREDIDYWMWTVANRVVEKAEADAQILQKQIEQLKEAIAEVASTVEQRREREALERLAVQAADRIVTEGATDETVDAYLSAAERAEGARHCVHGITPLGQWCRQCNPFRR